jgi:MoxR-like ATPase
MQRVVEEVYVSAEIKEYIVEIVQRTRETPQVKVGASPRGSLDLMTLARASAVMDNRDYVIPQDVKELVAISLGHRLVLEISSWLSGTSSELIIEKILNDVKTPRKE